MLVIPEHTGDMAHQLFVGQRPVTADLVNTYQSGWLIAWLTPYAVGKNTKKAMFPEEHGLMEYVIADD